MYMYYKWDTQSDYMYMYLARQGVQALVPIIKTLVELHVFR